MADGSSNTPRGAQKAIAILLFCLICIAVNFIGAQIAKSLNLPLFLDSLGTLVGAILGGSIPGIVIGYSTNIVNMAFDEVAIYYGVVNVLIAVVTARFAKRGWLESVFKVILLILILALIGGGLSSIITSWLFGFGFSGGASTPLAMWFFTHGIPGEFAAQFLADFIFDLGDKALMVIIAVVFTRLLPSSLHDLLECTFWQQAPLNSKQREDVSKTQPRTVSLRTKIVTIVSIVVVVVGLVTSVFSFNAFNESMVAEQAQKATGITNLALNAIDGNRVNTYLQEGESAEGYAQTEKELADIRESFSNVEYIYVYQIRQDGCHVVFDPDTPDERGSDLGEVIEFDEAFANQVDELLAGKEIEPVVSNESYGWLLSIYRPVTDDSGQCVAYVAVDLLMDDIIYDGVIFLGKILFLFLAFFIVILAFTLWVADFFLVYPINTIAYAASGFAYDDEETRDYTIRRIKRLKIKTGDEVENLYDAIVKTAEDTANFIEEGAKQAQTIERMQDSLIMVMADLVESRDQFTGDHVRKTSAYCRIILEQMEKEGIYADEINAQFASDVVRSAPLHDVGKIVVSDTILNKPGRLTDEEYDTMRTHTTAGREILERAVNAVSEPTYLDEARILAEFHHERWDGKGYPTGRSGREIPLSARIMAVADVFDALVSKRSYKEGMPIEKAFSIIREGAGTQFDPLVAKAFLDNEEAARAIAAEHGDDAGTQSFDIHKEES